MSLARVVSSNDLGAPDPGWQVKDGHYEPAIFGLHVIYPRPDAETNSYARHRWAYPGTLYEIPIGVQFGSYPYRYEMISGPAWLDIVEERPDWNGRDKFTLPEGYGILAGTAPGTDQAAESVTVRVYDQEHTRPDPSFVDVTFTVEVSAGAFVFLDPVNGDDGTADGTIGSPYKEVSALQDADLGQKICYVRDTSSLAEGYIPNPNRQFRFGTANEPVAYIGYPGETVTVNCKNSTGFNNGRIQDGFLAGMTVRDTNQETQSATNVRVCQRLGGSTQRETFWKLENINSFNGTSANDNYGFIIMMDEGLSGPGTGHQYIYVVDCVGRDMTASGGSNGPALTQTMACWRALTERCKGIGCSNSNNGFIDFKHSQIDCEHRAHDLSGNLNTTGGNRVRAAGGSNSTTSKRVTISYCKAGDVRMGGSDDSFNAEEFYAFRNTCRTVSSNVGLMGTARHNVTESVDANHTSEDDVIVDFDADVDDNMNLVGTVKEDWLGNRGAEVG